MSQISEDSVAFFHLLLLFKVGQSRPGDQKFGLLNWFWLIALKLQYRYFRVFKYENFIVKLAVLCHLLIDDSKLC